MVKTRASYYWGLAGTQSGRDSSPFFCHNQVARVQGATPNGTGTNVSLWGLSSGNGSYKRMEGRFQEAGDAKGAFGLRNRGFSGGLSTL